jgi:hypothetical protein
MSPPGQPNSDPAQYPSTIRVPSTLLVAAGLLFFIAGAVTLHFALFDSYCAGVGAVAGDNRALQILFGWLPFGGGVLAVASYALWRCSAWQDGRRPAPWLTTSATLLLLGWLAFGVNFAPSRTSSYAGREANAEQSATLAKGGETFAWVAHWSVLGWLGLQIACGAATFLLYLALTQAKTGPRLRSPTPAQLLFLVVAPPPILVLVISAAFSP